MRVYVCVCVRACMHVCDMCVYSTCVWCVCVCVREEERKRDGGREGGRERGKGEGDREREV